MRVRISFLDLFAEFKSRKLLFAYNRPTELESTDTVAFDNDERI